jgi:dTDP-4-dehydrorhamnose 3,5-epimerase
MQTGLAVLEELSSMPGVKLLTPTRHLDGRGWFSETFKASDFASDPAVLFVQDNQAFSGAPGTLRGLHFQVPPHAQAKLIRCVRGAVFDVAVDLRKGSPSYGKWVTAELTAQNGRQLFLPAGFAHGYVTTEAETELFYKVTDYYAPECERGLRFDDPDIGIEWPYPPSRMILSEKDRTLPLLRDFASPFVHGGSPLQPLEA